MALVETQSMPVIIEALASDWFNGVYFIMSPILLLTSPTTTKLIARKNSIIINVTPSLKSAFFDFIFYYVKPELG